MIRLLLVDDHPVVRDGLRGMFDSVEDITVVGEASDGEQAVSRAIAEQPDVVVMDLRMPGLPAPQAIRRVLAASPETGVLVLTMEDDPAVIVEVLHAGALAVLLKGADVDDVVRAVHAVAGGQLLLDPALVPLLVGRLAPAAAPPTRAVLPAELSPRELDVLRLLGQGLSTAAIAERLGVASKTVSNHTTTLLAKLGVGTRQEATRLAREAGVGG